MTTRDLSSFRDPTGFVFYEDGTPFRFVGKGYAREWAALRECGLIQELHRAELLIPHEEVASSSGEHADALAILRPEKIPFIAYPYEWCFSQLKEAALTTLEIQNLALARGQSLKDASAYNIQFLRRRPVFIDTLSFEPYEDGRPWQAYRQFCRHFVAPLALMAKVHPDFRLLLRPSLDGIPLDLASRSLPFRTRFQPGLAMHVHLHANAESRLSAPSKPSAAPHMSKTGLLGLLDSLRRLIDGLKWSPGGTVWADYYTDTNYSEAAMTAKHRAVDALLGEWTPAEGVVWDLGANTGAFSDIAARHARHVMAFDVDAAAVERHYLRADAPKNVLPLLQDLANPSPDLGWAHEERASLAARANADVVMALALVHHLAIGNNVPLDRIAEFFARLGPRLLIEFVPKEDSQVQRLLASRKDIFDGYTSEGFEQSFGRYYDTRKRIPIEGTVRSLYLMERR